MNEAARENISPIEKIIRQGARTILTPFIPGQVEGKENLTRIDDLLKKGYGIVTLYNHISLRDPLQILEDIVLNNKLMQNKEIALSVDLGGYRILKPLFGPLASRAKMKFCPVVNQTDFGNLKRKHDKQNKKAKNILLVSADSLNHLAERQTRERNELLSLQKKLLSLYFKTVLDVLGEGGIVLIAPQATRKEWLGIPTANGDEKSPSAVATLVAQFDHNKLDKVAFLFIGLGIKNANDYSLKKVGNYNLFGKYRKYIVHIGPILTKDELKQLGQTAGNENGKGKTRRGIEKAVREELAKVVPKEYLQTPLKEN